MTCTNCGTENDAGRKFCLECGQPLAATCPNCGTANPPRAKFCGECATPLGAATQAGAGPTPAGPAAAAGTQAERRLVSVLFADLVGFTPFAEGRDAEEVRETLDRYFELARDVEGWPRHLPHYRFVRFTRRAADGGGGSTQRRRSRECNCCWQRCF